MKREKIELLAPAGDLEKLKIAVDYGADAVYLGGEAFGLRKNSKNFTRDDLEEGIKYAHDRGVSVHVTMNIIGHNDDLDGAEEYAKDLYDLGVDAVLIADPGMFMKVKNACPNLDIHISTQASITNYDTVNFWHQIGAGRAVLARELSFDEIKEIRQNIPEDMELETFCHGAMCMAYSGRCLISNYMTNRDANRGDCAHPCRYKYHLQEETRPGEYFPVFEDEEGTFIMNSKDLCMIEHIPEFVEAGINSIKIEGRMKGIFYAAQIIRAYRHAIDSYYEDPKSYKFDKTLLEEIQKASHRDFSKGFFFGPPDESDNNYSTSSYLRGYDFLGLVKDYDKTTGYAIVEQRNRIFLGDEVEVFGPKIPHFVQKIDHMYDENGKALDVAPHAQQVLKIKMDQPVEKNYMLRIKRDK